MRTREIYDAIAKREPIPKGFSKDKKYCVTVRDGTKYLLRVSAIGKYEMYKNIFPILERIAAMGVPMCRPVELGVCPDGAYALYSWIDGENLSDALPKLSEAERYKLGVESGKILRLIHAIPAPENQEDWSAKYLRITETRIKQYRESDRAKFDGGEYFIEYVVQNRELLADRPQCFTHGDFSVHNIMLERGELRIIDFDKLSYADPWEEFMRIIFSAQVSPHFSTGQLHGYFDGEPPLEFFQLLAFYIASRTITAVEWAIPFGQEEIEFVNKMIKDTLRWHDDMSNPVPTWYLGNYSAG